MKPCADLERGDRDKPLENQDTLLDYRERVRRALAAFMAATPTRPRPRRRLWTRNEKTA